MTETGPRDDAKLAAIKLEWWPRSDWNRWPPSLESAFGLLLLVFHADEALFQTGWFIESLATQVLVIFVLRTRRNPLKSRPHPLLATTSVAVVVLAVVLPFTPLGTWFGFVPPSAAFLFAIAGLTVSYLLLAQGAKWAFYRRWSPVGAVPAPLIR